MLKICFPEKAKDHKKAETKMSNFMTGMTTGIKIIFILGDLALTVEIFESLGAQHSYKVRKH